MPEAGIAAGRNSLKKLGFVLQPVATFFSCESTIDVYMNGPLFKEAYLSRYLGRRAENCNKLAQDCDSRRGVERNVYRSLHRNWLSELSGSQLKVYLFILSRTLDWQKYAEAIPMAHFLNGLVEADGSLLRLECGAPVSRGTGIMKEDTVRTAIGFLRTLELITVFPGKRGTVTPANVYMPLSERMLAGFALNAGLGVLPDHMDFIWVDEHVWWSNKPWRVVGYAGDQLCLREAGASNDTPVLAASPAWVRRLSLSDWQSLKK